jgi:hypothetical protein
VSALEIVIQYPPAGAGEDTALAYARRLFAVLNETIDSLLLVPAAGAGVTVTLNGRIVYREDEARRPPRLSDVLDVLRQDEV